jgi:NTE family protein
MTTAFVLSGGGNRGPLQIGALQSLLEHGIYPDFLVGTSAGSLNAAFMAGYGPTLASIPKLAAAWHTADRRITYPGNPLNIAWRLLRRADSIFPNDGVRRLITANLPQGVTTFGQLQCPCYVTATDLQSRRLYLFGEDPDASVVEAVMASTAVPVMHPPLAYHGLQLVDGGVVANTPVGIAMEKGARRIYVINVSRGTEPKPPVRGVLQVLERTYDIFMSQSLFHDLAEAAKDPVIGLHHIHITDLSELAFDDFSKTDEMIVAGKRITDEYLSHPQPGVIAPIRSPGAALDTVPGAREYVPHYP